jgi:hypothetical protein
MNPSMFLTSVMGLKAGIFSGGGMAVYDMPYSEYIIIAPQMINLGFGALASYLTKDPAYLKTSLEAAFVGTLFSAGLFGGMRALINKFGNDDNDVLTLDDDIMINKVEENA